MVERGDDVTRANTPHTSCMWSKPRQSFISQEICTSLQQNTKYCRPRNFYFLKKGLVAGGWRAEGVSAYSVFIVSQASICSCVPPLVRAIQESDCGQQCVISILLAIIRNISTVITRFHFVFDHTEA